MDSLGPPRPTLTSATVIELGPFGSTRVSAGILSGVAGFVDTSAFLALFGLLPAHLTGNLVTAGAALGTARHVGLVARLSVVPLFMIAVALAAVVARAAKRRGAPLLAPLLALMTVTLAAFGASGTLLKRYESSPDAWAVILVGAAAVTSMGIQSTLMREVLGNLCPTTVMTGNLTQFTIDLVNLAYSLFDSDREQRVRARRRLPGRLIKFGLPVASFTFGAGLGGYLTNLFGLSSIALPTVVVGCLTGVAWRSSSTG
ncbi:MAG TPA: YoaK family protein [Polyangiaceae bacterium]|jgi:uncharacterized membrane protein YoaK (UPF0700 family)|nr:YoaK family protein [Polyangiaceae bacterium]